MQKFENEVVFIIYVCSAIMSTGKTSAVINYMDSHPDEKFIYITPYLDESDRIADGCNRVRFVKPSDKNPDGDFRKIGHTELLIKKGRNIATTHAAFKMYSPEMLDDIKKMGYTLVIDESLNVLEEEYITSADLELLVLGGYVEQDDDVYRRTNKEYSGGRFVQTLKTMETRELVKTTAMNQETVFYWALPPDLLTAFKNVFILTYLFEGQDLYYLLKMAHITYKKIGISKLSEREFEFSETEFYTPEYVSKLSSMIHICDDDKLNRIGDSREALSYSWFGKRGARNKDIIQLRNNINNYFKWKCPGAKRGDKLWATYANAEDKLKYKGYSNSYLVWNTRATNKYKDRHYLVYAVNLFKSPNKKIFYSSHGYDLNEDLYALSSLIQWIWRSAIRDGDEIYIYLPSKRMRELLQKWINDVQKNGNKL